MFNIAEKVIVHKGMPAEYTGVITDVCKSFYEGNSDLYQIDGDCWKYESDLSKIKSEF